MKRVVEPELLDDLPGNDPRALRSRRDLRMINGIMGNDRWILKQILEGETMVELGAGAGVLTRKLLSKGRVTGLDFLEKPKDLEVEWSQGNLFQTMPKSEGETVVANMILHHFDDEGLEQLGKLIQSRKRLIAVEPYRSKNTLLRGKLIWPLVGSVTRHDMMVSIRAGFQTGEIQEALRLGSAWKWREEISMLGSIRVEACRQ